MTLIYGVTSNIAEGDRSGEPNGGIGTVSAGTEETVADQLDVKLAPGAAALRRSGAEIHGQAIRRKVRLNHAVQPAGYFRWKRYFDFAASLVLLIPGLPLMGLVWLFVRWSSPGPVFFRQRRVGAGGRHFHLYKFRTMWEDAEARTGPVWAAENDPRVTPVGWWLRKFHLDELPQLFNVLRGEMSLVGPRPERPDFVAVLEPLVPGYRHRISVAPGVTGLAQLNLPPDTDLCSVCRKTIVDLDYIEHANPWMDLRIVLCTALRMPKLASGWLLHVFRVSRRVAIEGCPRGVIDPHQRDATNEKSVAAEEPDDEEEMPSVAAGTLEPCCEPIRRLTEANGRASILFQRLAPDSDPNPRKPR